MINQVTENVSFLDLNEPLSIWSNSVLDCKNKVIKNTTQQIKAASFDIKTEAVKLQNFYLSKIRCFE